MHQVSVAERSISGVTVMRRLPTLICKEISSEDGHSKNSVIGVLSISAI